MGELEFPIRVRDNGTVIVTKFGKAVRRVGQGARRAGRLMTRAFRGVGNSIKNTLKRVFSLQGALVAIGGAAILRSFIRVGNVVETARARLIGLRGGVDEANKAFDNLSNLASRVAFSLEDVVEAGVAVEAFGAKSEDVLSSVTDLAAFMGLDLPQAASAFGRAFAAGAGAADILRERGVLTLVSLRTGIDDLTKLTLPQFREALLTAMRDPMGPIAGAAERLSTTFKGVFSFLGDAVFRLQTAILEAGLGDLIKDVIRLVTDFFKLLLVVVKQNEPAIRAFFDGLRETLPTIVGVLQSIAFAFADIGKAIQVLSKDLEFFFPRTASAVNNLGKSVSDVELPVLRLREQLDFFLRTARNAAEATEAAGKGLADFRVGAVSLADGLDIMSDRTLEVADALMSLPNITDALLPKLDDLQLQFLETGKPEVLAQFDLLADALSQIGVAAAGLPEDARLGLEGLLLATKGGTEELLATLREFNDKRKKDEEDTNAKILRNRELLKVGSVRLFGALASFSETQGAAAFETTKKFQIAEAITSGILAIQKTLGQGGFAAIPLAAAMAIQTAANVRRIQATQPGGGGGGVTAPGGGGAAPGGVTGGAEPVAIQAAQPVQQLTVNIEGFGFVGDQAEFGSLLADVLREAQTDGAQQQVIT